MNRSTSSAHRALAAPDVKRTGHFTAATYNIHRCVGTDGRYSPSRVADVLEEIEADVLGLQEVDGRLHFGPGPDQISYLANRLGFHSFSGVGFAANCGGRCANAVLSRWPISASRLIDLTIPGREPRSAVEAEIRLPGPVADADAGRRLRVGRHSLRFARS